MTCLVRNAQSIEAYFSHILYVLFSLIIQMKKYEWPKIKSIICPVNCKFNKIIRYLISQFEETYPGKEKTM